MASTVSRRMLVSRNVMSQAEENGWYGRASLFLVIKFNQEYDDYFKSLQDVHCFYSAISVRLPGNNSLINRLILRILTSLEIFLNYKSYCRLPGLTNVYNNGTTEPAKNIFSSYVLMFQLTRGL